MPIILFAILATFFPSVLGIITVHFVGPNISSEYQGQMDLLILSSVLSLVVGFCILSSIAVVTKLAKGNRKLLLNSFKPMLKFTQFATAFLVATHAYTITASIYFLEAYLIGRVHLVLIGIVGLVGGWTALKILWFSITKFKEAETKVLGKAIIKSDQPKLWKLVEEVCQKTGSDLPENIVLGLSPNFFVTESQVLTLDENLNGKTLYLSLPFSRLLNRDELKAIVAHEMGHFIGQDTDFSKRFYPIYRGAQNTIALLSDQSGDESKNGHAGGVALLPSLAINSFFFDQFSKLESEIGRKRELEADQVSANSFGERNLAIALVKAHTYGVVWSVNEETMLEALSNGKEIKNASVFFEAFVKTLDMKKIEEFLGASHVEHPTDSHPSLDLRLKSLNYELTLDELTKIQNEEKSDAFELISDIELLEEELTKHENEKLITISKFISHIKRNHKAAAAKEKKEEHYHVFSELLRKMIVMTAMIDGKIEDREKSSLIDVYHSITGDKLDRHDLIADINSYKDWSEAIFKLLEASQSSLNKSAKVLLIKAVLMVAVSDNDFADEEKGLVSIFAETLGLSSYDLKKVLDEMFEEKGKNIDEEAS